MSKIPISAAVSNCDKAFCDLATQLSDRSIEELTGLKRLDALDAADRFKIWAGNLGAFKSLSSEASLEFRLRESPKITSQISDLLLDLEATLRSCKTCLPDMRPKS